MIYFEKYFYVFIVYYVKGIYWALYFSRFV